jgi:hypothetical protein
MEEIAAAIARVDATLQRLRQELEEKRDEVGILEERIRRLAEARNVIAHELEGGPDGPDDGEQLAFPLNTAQAIESSTTLRAEVVRVLKEVRVIGGLAASDVANYLMTRGRGLHVPPKVFYSMVYTALMRATRRGEAVAIETGKGRRFIPVGPKEESKEIGPTEAEIEEMYNPGIGRTQK